MRKDRASLFVALLVAATLGGACSAPDSISGIAIAAPNADLIISDTAYHLTGHGNYSTGNQPDIVVNSIRTFSGGIKGNVVVPKDGLGKVGNVVEIAPPSTSYDYWCVAAALNDQPGITYLIYIRDMATGTDQITFNSGPGATCAAFPVPPFEWMSLVSGDFDGSITVKKR